MTSGDFMKKYDWIVVDGNNMYIVEQWLAEFIYDNVNIYSPNWCICFITREKT